MKRKPSVWVVEFYRNGVWLQWDSYSCCPAKRAAMKWKRDEQAELGREIKFRLARYERAQP